MKKPTLLPLFLALGLVLSGCSKEDETINRDSSNNSSSDSTYNDSTTSQEGGNIFGNMFGDNSTSADEMRLENYTGSITLQNNSEEKAVVLGSRLVTGDNLETMVESNAYVVLDASKVLRVNETSQVEIVQEDKHLDIHLSKGTLFFNVTSALSAEESLEFHTNNVVTGVRGTSGIIHYDPVAQVTQIVVLTGLVTGTTISEEQNIEAGQVAIVETLPDGTVKMTIYELEEDPIYYFPDHFIDGMQGDLNFEGDSFNLSELVREPSEVSISGKVLSISNVLAVEDENGKLHSIDNSSGQTWEGVTLGGMVNLTYFGDSVVSMEQTSQGADVVGAVLEMFSYNFEDFDYFVYIDISTTVLTQAEKEVFITRLQAGYANTELRLGSWEDLVADAESNGLTAVKHEFDILVPDYYEGYSNCAIRDLPEHYYALYNIPTDAGIENFGLETYVLGTRWLQAILNSDTMEYTVISHGAVG